MIIYLYRGTDHYLGVHIWTIHMVILSEWSVINMTLMVRPLTKWKWSCWYCPEPLICWHSPFSLECCSAVFSLLRMVSSSEGRRSAEGCWAGGCAWKRGIRAETGMTVWQRMRVVYECVRVCGKRRTRERPPCLRSDSVFAVGHSIFLKRGGEILDSDQIRTV